MKKHHQQALQALFKRIQKERMQQIKQRQQDCQRLLCKNKNIRNELVHKHQFEAKKAGDILKENLYISHQTSLTPMKNSGQSRERYAANLQELDFSKSSMRLNAPVSRKNSSQHDSSFYSQKPSHNSGSLNQNYFQDQPGSLYRLGAKQQSHDEKSSFMKASQDSRNSVRIKRSPMNRTFHK